MKTHRVIVAVMLNGSFGREAAQGIAEYALSHTRARWEIEFDGASNHPESQTRIRRMIREWKPHVIIGQITVGALPRAIQRAGIRAVSISSFGAWAFPLVLPDHAAGGTLAAEYLAERKLRNFAYCGMSATPGALDPTDPMGAAFTVELRKRGFACELYAPSKRAVHGTGDIDDLRRWLRRLPTPVGILAFSDLRGGEVIQACRGMGLRVPDDTAVLGANNDPLLCSLCSPPLSSIMVSAHQVGFEAAKLADALMNGARPPREPKLCPPRGIATRQSTDILHVADPDLAAAIRYIRENAGAPINVADVIVKVSVSRRSLERRFIGEFGRTPHAEILRARFERARTLLAESSLKITDVARSSGFGRHVKFAKVFKQHVGVAPSEYRERYSGHGSS